MEDFIKLGLTEEQAEAIMKACDDKGLSYESAIDIIRNKDKIVDTAKSVMDFITESIKSIADWIGSLGINPHNYSHNYAMATYSKKKRTRKKYAKRCFNH